MHALDCRVTDSATYLNSALTPLQGDFFFCIPIVFGCPDKTSQEGDGTPYVCPRCHNAQVVEAKSRTWFEICWIPLVRTKLLHD